MKYPIGDIPYGMSLYGMSHMGYPIWDIPYAIPHIGISHTRCAIWNVPYRLSHTGCPIWDIPYWISHMGYLLVVLGNLGLALIGLLKPSIRSHPTARSGAEVCDTMGFLSWWLHSQFILRTCSSILCLWFCTEGVNVIPELIAHVCKW